MHVIYIIENYVCMAPETHITLFFRACSLLSMCATSRPIWQFQRHLTANRIWNSTKTNRQSSPHTPPNNPQRPFCPCGCLLRVVHHAALGRLSAISPIRRGWLSMSFAPCVFPGLIIGRKISKLRQSTAFYWAHTTIFGAKAILSGTYFFFASKLEKKMSKSEIPKKFKK